MSASSTCSDPRRSTPSAHLTPSTLSKHGSPSALGAKRNPETPRINKVCSRDRTGPERQKNLLRMKRRNLVRRLMLRGRRPRALPPSRSRVQRRFKKSASIRFRVKESCCMSRFTSWLLPSIKSEI